VRSPKPVACATALIPPCPNSSIPAQEGAAIAQIQIKVDNGPESSGVRTQFLKRIVEFVDHTRKIVQLLYYPYMDSSPFASISSLLDWGTTAHIYPVFELSAIALAIMGYSRVCT
jgi:hypothetical protein